MNNEYSGRKYSRQGHGIAETMMKDNTRSGMALWYRRFVSDLASVVNKESSMELGDEQQATFAQLKELLTDAPVFPSPNFANMTLPTDVSNNGIDSTRR